MVQHFLSYIEKRIRENWNNVALSDLNGGYSYSYSDLAVEISRMQVLFLQLGIKKGDKISICGKNSSNWAIVFLSVAVYEGVSVLILPDFTVDDILNLVEHSESRLLFVDDSMSSQIDVEKIPNVTAVISLRNFSLVYAKSDFVKKSYDECEKSYFEKYPKGFSVEQVHYPVDNLEKLAVINYTSGTTSMPKGVMLSYNNLSSNVQFAIDKMGYHSGQNILSMLPLAHMFGLMFELLYQLSNGCSIYFLGKTPSPAVLMNAFQKVNPYMVLTVPLVIEKIFKSKIFPVLDTWKMKFLWHMPFINSLIKKKIRNQLLNSFGGKLDYLIIGGAALNERVEKCLRAIKFPYTVGYGMTECGPIIGYEDYNKFELKSCGKIVDRLQVKIDSSDSQRKVGEILVKGENVMMGYFKQEEISKKVITEDGWLRTGDLGVIDKNGNIFIRGRSKNMILGPSGQNIYPEEIENKINEMEGVVESVVVERKGRLVGLILPNYEMLKKMNVTVDIFKDEVLQRLNKILPIYSKLSQIETVAIEFEKTPKRSIKRFLYK